ncbi:hypothetical protein EFQ99_18375 [Rhizobium vallis]|uniref:Uncharacterized protein n=1 Tax=Rhizobium vallis TaxID=634290 RepID=A0A3S0R8C9_9HYPH|nr:hypothetical protein EFQ99_18375 [Rhizobium vallis]
MMLTAARPEDEFHFLTLSTPSWLRADCNEIILLQLGSFRDMCVIDATVTKRGKALSMILVEPGEPLVTAFVISK